MKPLALTLLFTLVLPSVIAQDYRVVFEGRPLKKIESSFEQTTAQNLSADQSFEYSVRIVERQGKYYWASRGMLELAKNEGGGYIIYHAVNGAGYIKVGSQLLLDLRDQLPAEQREKEVGYIENMHTQFVSIIYYGNRVQAR